MFFSTQPKLFAFTVHVNRFTMGVHAVSNATHGPIAQLMQRALLPPHWRPTEQESLQWKHNISSVHSVALRRILWAVFVVMLACWNDNNIHLHKASIFFHSRVNKRIKYPFKVHLEQSESKSNEWRVAFLHSVVIKYFDWQSSASVVLHNAFSIVDVLIFTIGLFQMTVFSLDGEERNNKRQGHENLITRHARAVIVFALPTLMNKWEHLCSAARCRKGRAGRGVERKQQSTLGTYHHLARFAVIV